MFRVQMITLLALGLCTSAGASSFDRVQSCLNELIGSKETMRYFPNLANEAASGNFDARTLEFLEEADRFCKCHANSPVKKSDPFPDVEAKLAHEDSCAGKTLGGDGFEVHYQVAQTRLSQEISWRLQQRYPRAVRQLASVGSYNMKMSCLHESIMNRCSRSKSLQMGYQCILQITTSKDFSRFEANCPEFNDQSLPISDQHDLMI